MKTTRYVMERYSPSRGKWVQLNNHFESEERAKEQVAVETFNHRDRGLKFRYTAVTYDPRKGQVKQQLKELDNKKQIVKDEAEKLSHDPKKERLKELASENKEIERKRKELLKELEGLEDGDWSQLLCSAGKNSGTTKT